MTLVTTGPPFAYVVEQVTSANHILSHLNKKFFPQGIFRIDAATTLVYRKNEAILLIYFKIFYLFLVSTLRSQINL
jgi:hypothetical protein